MKKRITATENLDEIGNRLIAAARVRNEEIENIVSKPNLFKSVAAQIEKEKGRREETGIFGDSFGLGWRKIGLSFGVLGISAAVLAGWLLFSESDLREISVSENYDYTEKNDSAVSTESIPSQQKYAIENTESRASNAAAKKDGRRLAVKTEIKRRLKSLPKERLSPRKISKPISDEDVFYSLNYAGDFSNEDSRQIVRVELTRDALAALGVNSPVADENETVKTDLIVGSDGLPQAFRFVKNF